MPRLNLPLRLAIILSGKRQKRIAKLTRICESDLSEIVNGRKQASPERRARLARVLGKPESELFSGSL